MNPATIAKSGTEFAEQCALFAMCALNVRKYPELKWFHSIQNEEKSGNAIRGARGKASGKRKGVSDTSFPVRRGGYSGLYIELKNAKGKPSEEQLEFGSFVQTQGFYFAVCYGWENAWNCVEWYLNLK